MHATVQTRATLANTKFHDIETALRDLQNSPYLGTGFADLAKLHDTDPLRADIEQRLNGLRVLAIQQIGHVVSDARRALASLLADDGISLNSCGSFQHQANIEATLGQFRALSEVSVALAAKANA